MKKRLVSLLLASAMLLALLVGCGNQAAAPDQSSASAASQTEASEPAPAPVSTPAEEASAPAAEESIVETPSIFPLEEPVTFTYWFNAFPSILSQLNLPEDLLAYKELEQRTNVHIDFQVVAADMTNEKLNIMVASGLYPDFAPASGAGLDKDVEDGYLLRLNDLIDEYMPNYKALRESNDVYRRGSITDEGNMVLINGFFDEGNVIEYGPVIRQDWLDQLNLPMPETYDELEETLTMFKNQLGAQAPMFLNKAGSIMGNYLSAGFGVAACDVQDTIYINVDGTVQYSGIQPGYREYLELVRKWYADGLIDRDFISRQDLANAPEELIAQDAIGYFYTFDEKIPKLSEYNQDPNFNVVPAYDVTKNKGDVNHLRKESGWVSEGMGITTACQNPELAAQWMDYKFTPEGSLLFNYGTEGESFEYGEDGLPHFTDLVLHNPDGLTVSAAMYKYCCQRGQFLMETRRAYDYIDPVYSEMWGRHENDYYLRLDELSMTTEEAEQFNALSVDIDTYVSEMRLRFITGEADLESGWDEYVSSIENMGIDECVALVQAALDRYLER